MRFARMFLEVVDRVGPLGPFGILDSSFYTRGRCIACGECANNNVQATIRATGGRECSCQGVHSIALRFSLKLAPEAFSR